MQQQQHAAKDRAAMQSKPERQQEGASRRPAAAHQMLAGRLTGLSIGRQQAERCGLWAAALSRMKSRKLQGQVREGTVGSVSAGTSTPVLTPIAAWCVVATNSDGGRGSRRPAMLQ